MPASLDSENLFALVSNRDVNSGLCGNAVLKDRADALLFKHKGVWISLDKFETFAEFLSAPFVKLSHGSTKRSAVC